MNPSTHRTTGGVDGGSGSRRQGLKRRVDPGGLGTDRSSDQTTANGIPAALAATVPEPPSTHSRRWDMIRAEMLDTQRAQARPKRPCIYCGAKTKAVSQVCTAHSDLPSADPHFNVQTERYA